MRVHELAKEINKENKEVIEFLRSKNVEVKSHMSSVDSEEADMVRKHFAAPSGDMPSKAAPKAETK